MADEQHARPAAVDDATVEAVGKVSEAIEWLERARGRLYDFHQMLGRRVRDELVAGRRHIFEAELKEKRRTSGRAGHESRPPDAHAAAVATD